MSSERLEDLAAAVADGAGLEATEPEADQAARSLRTIDQISRAFRDCRPDSAPRESLFSWRHLEAVEVIGKGGFGIVYRAYDPLLKRDVALKLGNAKSTDGEDRDHLIIAEARRMARLRHPNILAIHGADQADGQTGIWSDLLEGKTLQQVVDQGGRLDPKLVLTLARPLVDALCLIHGGHMTHGDLKPANVMILASGEPVLMDFGAGADPTSHGPLIGSPAMMAPELFHGAVQSPASDVYAFGAMLYYLLLGGYPLDAATVDELIERHQRGDRPDLSRLPRLLRSLVARCLATRPEQRPTSRQLLAELDQRLAAPQTRRLRLAIGAVMASLALGLAVSSIGFLKARQSAQQANQERLRAQSTLGFLESMLAAPSPSRSGRQLRVEQLLDAASAELDRAPPGAIEELQLRTILGRTYRSLHLLKQARTQIGRALELQAAIAGASSVRTWELELDLARIDLESGLLDSAGEQFSRLERAAAREFGENSRWTLEARYYRGLTASRVSDLPLQQKLLEDVVGKLSILPEDDPLRGQAPSLLSEFYRDSGRLDEAEVLARQALQWEIDNHGEDGYGTVAKRHMLATVLNCAAKYGEAEGLARRALSALDGFALGVTADQIHLNSTLAGSLYEQGRAEEALATELQSQRMVADYPFSTPLQIVSVTGNIGTRYAGIGQYDQAIEYTLEAVTLAREALGPRAAMTLFYEDNLAEHYLAAGQPAKALEWARQTFAASRDVLGPDHLVTLFAADNLGAAQIRNGELTAGLDLLEKNRAGKQEAIGLDHPNTWDTTEYVIEGRLASGKISSELVAMAEGLLAHRTERLPAGHRKITIARELLARARAAN